MHERQAAVVLSILLVLSVVFANESFGEKYQRNAYSGNDEEKKDKKGGEDSNKFKDWKKENDKHDDDDERDNNHSFDDLQKQITDLQNQIKNIVLGIIYWNDIKEIPEDIADGDDDALGDLVCGIDQVPVFNGESWECSIDVASPTSPIFFHHFRLNSGEIQWAGITDSINDLPDSINDIDKITIVFPTSGELSSLYAKLGDSGDIDSPRNGEQYTLTIIKNKVEETELTCIIPESVNFCTSGDVKISVIAGDEILIKAKSSNNAPFAIIKSSVIFKGP